MLEVIGRGALTAVLIVAVVSKLADPRRSAAAMATYGFRSVRSQWGALAIVVAAESVLAVGIAIGSAAAAYAAAAMMLLFAATLGSALMQGRAGAPCACFGAGSTVSGAAIARNLVLAAAFALLPVAAGRRAQHGPWLGTGPRAGAARLRRACRRGARAGARGRHAAAAARPLGGAGDLARGPGASAAAPV